MSPATAPETVAPAAPTHPAAKLSALDAACALMASDYKPWQMLLTGLTWADYQRLLDARAAAGRAAVRIAYDRGEAEVMTVSNRHERWKKLIARLLETIALARAIPVAASGNFTIQREDLDRGFEPDECYYVQNAARVQAVRELDFRTDPPPDLAIEVVASRRLGDRLRLYDAIGVPEVWRYDGGRLTILHRGPAGGYTEAAASLALPGVTADLLGGYLGRAGTVGDTALCLELFAWARPPVPPAAPA